MFKKNGLLLVLLWALVQPLLAEKGADPTRPMTSEPATNAVTDDNSSPSTLPTSEKSLRLYQIMQSKQGNKALINGKMLQVNDKIQDYTVSKIEAYEVSLFNNDTKKTLVISIFNQSPKATPPTSNTNPPNTTATGNSPSNSTNSNSLPSSAIPKEAAILKSLDIDKINIDQLLKPLQGSKP